MSIRLVLYLFLLTLSSVEITYAMVPGAAASELAAKLATESGAIAAGHFSEHVGQYHSGSTTKLSHQQAVKHLKQVQAEAKHEALHKAVASETATTTVGPTHTFATPTNQFIPPAQPPGSAQPTTVFTPEEIATHHVRQSLEQFAPKDLKLFEKHQQRLVEQNPQLFTRIYELIEQENKSRQLMQTATTDLTKAEARTMNSQAHERLRESMQNLQEKLAEIESQQSVQLADPKTATQPKTTPPAGTGKGMLASRISVFKQQPSLQLSEALQEQFQQHQALIEQEQRTAMQKEALESKKSTSANEKSARQAMQQEFKDSLAKMQQQEAEALEKQAVAQQPLAQLEPGPKQASSPQRKPRPQEPALASSQNPARILQQPASIPRSRASAQSQENTDSAAHPTISQPSKPTQKSSVSVQPPEQLSTPAEPSATPAKPAAKPVRRTLQDKKNREASRSLPTPAETPQPGKQQLSEQQASSQQSIAPLEPSAQQASSPRIQRANEKTVVSSSLPQLQTSKDLPVQPSKKPSEKRPKPSSSAQPRKPLSTPAEAPAIPARRTLQDKALKEPISQPTPAETAKEFTTQLAQQQLTERQTLTSSAETAKESEFATAQAGLQEEYAKLQQQLHLTKMTEAQKAQLNTFLEEQQKTQLALEQEHAKFLQEVQQQKLTLQEAQSHEKLIQEQAKQWRDLQAEINKKVSSNKMLSDYQTERANAFNELIEKMKKELMQTETQLRTGTKNLEAADRQNIFNKMQQEAAVLAAKAAKESELATAQAELQEEYAKLQQQLHLTKMTEAQKAQLNTFLEEQQKTQLALEQEHAKFLQEAQEQKLTLQEAQSHEKLIQEQAKQWRDLQAEINKKVSSNKMLSDYQTERANAFNELIEKMKKELMQTETQLRTGTKNLEAADRQNIFNKMQQEAAVLAAKAAKESELATAQAELQEEYAKLQQQLHLTKMTEAQKAQLNTFLEEQQKTQLALEQEHAKFLQEAQEQKLTLQEAQSHEKLIQEQTKLWQSAQAKIAKTASDQMLSDYQKNLIQQHADDFNELIEMMKKDLMQTETQIRSGTENLEAADRQNIFKQMQADGQKVQAQQKKLTPSKQPSKEPANSNKSSSDKSPKKTKGGVVRNTSKTNIKPSSASSATQPIAAQNMLRQAYNKLNRPQSASRKTIHATHHKHHMQLKQKKRQEKDKHAPNMDEEDSTAEELLTLIEPLTLLAMATVEEDDEDTNKQKEKIKFLTEADWSEQDESSIDIGAEQYDDDLPKKKFIKGLTAEQISKLVEQIKAINK